jgi:hypothetical protein
LMDAYMGHYFANCIEVDIEIPSKRYPLVLWSISFDK